MLTVNKLIPQGQGLAPVLLKRAASVELDWDTRSRSAFQTTDSMQRRLNVNLQRGSLLRGGDVLVADDGTLLRVSAALQPVLRVRPCAEHGTAQDLVRAAYMLGQGQVAVELHGDHLRLAADPAWAESLRAMHLIVDDDQATFEPLPVAAPGSTGATAKPVNIAVKAAAHVHGPGCGHDHGGHGH